MRAANGAANACCKMSALRPSRRGAARYQMARPPSSQSDALSDTLHKLHAQESAVLRALARVMTRRGAARRGAGTQRSVIIQHQQP